MQFLSAVIALEIKYKAPKAHTLLELVYVRWGRWAHMVRGVPFQPACLPSAMLVPSILLAIRLQV